MSLPTLSELAAWLDPTRWGLSSTDARLLVLVLGAVLVVAGARVYRLMIVTPGFVGGVLAAVHYAPKTDDLTQAMIAGGCGLAGGFVMLMMEQTALRLVGVAIMVGLTEAIAPEIFGRDVPWFVPFVTGIIGAVGFPYVYRRALTILTPVLGAIAIAWGLGRQHDLELILALGVGGALLQTLVTARGKNA